MRIAIAATTLAAACYCCLSAAAAAQSSSNSPAADAFKDQTTGRIYRVAPKGAKPRKVTYDFASVPGLIHALTDR